MLVAARLVPFSRTAASLHSSELGLELLDRDLPVHGGQDRGVVGLLSLRGQVLWDERDDEPQEGLRVAVPEVCGARPAPSAPRSRPTPRTSLEGQSTRKAQRTDTQRRGRPEPSRVRAEVRGRAPIALSPYR